MQAICSHPSARDQFRAIISACCRIIPARTSVSGQPSSIICSCTLANRARTASRPADTPARGRSATIICPAHRMNRRPSASRDPPPPVRCPYREIGCSCIPSRCKYTGDSCSCIPVIGSDTPGRCPLRENTCSCIPANRPHAHHTLAVEKLNPTSQVIVHGPPERWPGTLVSRIHAFGRWMPASGRRLGRAEIE